LGIKTLRNYNALIADKSVAGVAVAVTRSPPPHVLLREPAHFTFFRDTVLPYLKKTVVTRICACGARRVRQGEESYTWQAHDEFLTGQIPQGQPVLATDLRRRC
jgi:chemotaxis methyl-accepting protein methylase